MARPQFMRPALARDEKCSSGPGLSPCPLAHPGLPQCPARETCPGRWAREQKFDVCAQRRRLNLPLHGGGPSASPRAGKRPSLRILGICGTLIGDWSRRDGRKTKLESRRARAALRPLFGHGGTDYGVLHGNDSLSICRTGRKAGDARWGSQNARANARRLIQGLRWAPRWGVPGAANQASPVRITGKHPMRDYSDG